MNKKIAVLSDDEGLPTTLIQVDSVVVYAYDHNGWQENLRFSCHEFPKVTTQDLRQLGQAIAGALGDVKIILGTKIAGAFYSILNRAGFMICESEGISNEFFDELYSQLLAEQNDPVGTSVQLQLGELPGHYFIDIKAVQKCHPLLSSKMILRPIFDGIPWDELVVRCDHEPQWLNDELSDRGLVIDRKMVDTNDWRLTINKMTCTPL